MIWIVFSILIEITIKAQKIMSKKKDVHVVPNSNGGWDVKRENSERASKHTETKQEAVDFGKGLANKDNVEFVPHKRDGTIQNPNSYGNDNNPPKDTKH